MELFQRAKAVRLKSHHDKYLFADEDELHVVQDRNGASQNARWAVEPVPHAPEVLRLRSRYGRYLTASNEPFLLGVTGRKVLQTLPERLDSSLEWEPVRDGLQAKLKTRYGNYLRANGGVPPWRNSVTHDVPHRSSTQDWVLWDVEIVQVLTPGPEPVAEVAAPDSPPAPQLRPPPPPHAAHHRRASSGAGAGCGYSAQPPPHPAHHRPASSGGGGHNAQPPHSASPEHRLSHLESSASFSVPLHKVDGRTIHYHIADDHGNVDEAAEGHSFTFNGTSLEELMHKLQEETGLHDIIICSRNPINGKLYPLRLQLPPNNAMMHIVLVQESSRVAKTFPKYGS